MCVCLCMRVRQFQGPVLGALRSELKYSGPDFTTTGILALGQRLGGTGVGINYFQTVTQHLALGGARAIHGPCCKKRRVCIFVCLLTGRCQLILL